MKQYVLCLLTLHFAISQASAEKPADRMGLAFFEEQIRPIIVEHCYKCHSAETKSLRGSLRMDSREGLLKGGDHGPALVPGQPEQSRLLQSVRYQGDLKMPPKGKLSDKQIAALTRWIEMGAPDPRTAAPAARARVIDIEAGRKHWAFQPLQATAPAQSEGDAWSRTIVDRFIASRQKSLGLKPNPEAPRRLLIRRAYFDLLGLPPTPEAIDAFEKDADPEAFEKLIDQLLESPHYGERWARHWMDIARFAESHGYEQDYDRKFAFHYRDFLIKAFNADMPFDQFVRWQLAGDELASDDPLALTATGFLGGGAFPTQLTEMEFESARYDELDDMASTTAVAFLGLSLGCARCHDHKYDPLETKDYYRFLANFATTIRSEIDLSIQPGQKPEKVQVTSEGFLPTKHHADGRGFPHFYKEVHLLHRGDPRQKREVVTPGYLRVLMTGDKQEDAWRKTPPADWKRTSFRRAGLAHWLTDTEHGSGQLVARVIVNRLWQHHFGRGLVATPNDFGTQGEKPTHPELLDWLAKDLIDHGWKLKRLHKLMMASAVYRQSSQSDEARSKIDRDNMYHWRRTPRRLEAEAIRDAMLSVAGTLDKTMFGPGTLDPNTKRRSVYFFIKRSQLIPMMMLFDWPEHLVSIGERSVTTVAPQALLFMNSPQGRQFAAAFTTRLQSVPAGEQLVTAYRLAFGRTPTDAERKLAEQFLDQQREAYRKTGNGERLALTDLCQSLLSANEFVYVD